MSAKEIARLTALELKQPDRAAETEPLFDDGLPHHYGGRSLAQAVYAASLTVDDPELAWHSLHACFISPGIQGVPVEFAIDRLREGRSFATRAVDSHQRASTVLASMVSFHRRAGGEEWEEPVGALPPLGEPVNPGAHVATPLGPFEVRVSGGVSELGWPRHPLWVRAAEPVPDDQRVHDALLAYLSDAGLVWSSRAAGTAALATWRIASLDHAMWVHREPRVDEWLCFEVAPMVNGHGRGLVRATVRTMSSELVATVVQETLIQPRARGAQAQE